MDSRQDSVSKLQHFENEAAVIGHLAQDLPRAIWSGVEADFKANPVKRSVEAIATAAVTAAVYIGARRAPVIARDASVVGGVAGGIAQGAPAVGELEKFVQGTANLLSKGWDANDSGTREKLGQEYATAVGRHAAPLAEISLGAAIGGASGHALLKNVKADAWLTANLTEKAEYGWRWRAFGAEKHLLNKSGSFNASESLLNADGTANFLKASEAIDNGHRTLFNRALRSVDPHVEEGRVIDFSSNRVSAPLRGSTDSIDFGFTPKNPTMHSHPEYVGARPSVSDVTHHNGVNMLKSGDDIALFLGQRGQYTGLPKDFSVDQIFAERGAPTLKALIVNPKEQTARVLEGDAIRNPFASPSAPFEETWRWGETFPQYVDYKSSADVLSRVQLDDPAAVASQIGRLTQTVPVESVGIERRLLDLKQLSP